MKKSDETDGLEKRAIPKPRQHVLDRLDSVVKNKKYEPYQSKKEWEYWAADYPNMRVDWSEQRWVNHVGAAVKDTSGDWFKLLCDKGLLVELAKNERYSNQLLMLAFNQTWFPEANIGVLMSLQPVKGVERAEFLYSEIRNNDLSYQHIETLMQAGHPVKWKNPEDPEGVESGILMPSKAFVWSSLKIGTILRQSELLGVVWNTAELSGALSSILCHDAASREIDQFDTMLLLKYGADPTVSKLNPTLKAASLEESVISWVCPPEVLDATSHLLIDKLAQSAWSFDQAIAMQWAAYVLKHRSAEVMAEGGGEKVSQFPICAMLLEHGQLREATDEARSVEPAKGSFRL